MMVVIYGNYPLFEFLHSMLVFIAWLLICILLNTALLLLNYWQNLFQKQKSYTRNELLALGHILQHEFKYLIKSKASPIYIYLTFIISLLFAWFLVFLGGLLAWDISPAPDMASDQLSNYFFQSFLILLVLHIIEPHLQNFMPRDLESLWHKIFATKLYFYLGLATSLASINSILWLIYHEMNFLYGITNAPLCLAYAYYRLQKDRQGSESNVIEPMEKERSTALEELAKTEDAPLDINDIDFPEPNFEEPPQ